MSKESNLAQAMIKLQFFHHSLCTEISQTKERINDLIGAYGLQKIAMDAKEECGTEEFKGMEKGMAHIEKIVDSSVLSLEKSLQDYYRVTGRVFKPTQEGKKP